MVRPGVARLPVAAAVVVLGQVRGAGTGPVGGRLVVAVVRAEVLPVPAVVEPQDPAAQFVALAELERCLAGGESAGGETAAGDVGGLAASSATVRKHFTASFHTPHTLAALKPPDRSTRSPSTEAVTPFVTVAVVAVPAEAGPAAVSPTARTAAAEAHVVASNFLCASLVVPPCVVVAWWSATD